MIESDQQVLRDAFFDYIWKFGDIQTIIVGLDKLISTGTVTLSESALKKILTGKYGSISNELKEEITKALKL